MKLKKKLDNIILIDDDAPTNFLHRMVIEEFGCAETVISFQSGILALEYLLSNVNTDGNKNNYRKPDLIFLDINMPRMNGWEFLAEYAKLPEEQKSRIVIMLLTTSMNPDDKAMAAHIHEVNGFYNKPLDEEILKTILEKHFSENIE